jgi:hypothetical protein
MTMIPEDEGLDEPDDDLIQFKRTYHPLINSDVSNGFDSNAHHVIQAVAARDAFESVIVAFSRDDGHSWYGYHKSTARSLDEFEARFQ